MVKSNQVFKPTRNNARIALLLLCVGLGSSQLVMSPPLGDPMSMLDDQKMENSSPQKSY